VRPDPAPNNSEIAFDALGIGLEVEYARDSIDFHWTGGEEGTEADRERIINRSVVCSK
jgi:hypothetical protein